jgi:hypothetical protein
MLPAVTRDEVIWLRAVPRLLFAAAVLVAVLDQVGRNGLDGLGLSLLLAVGFAGIALKSGVGYLRKPKTTMSKNEAMLRGGLDVAVATFIVTWLVA